MTAENAAPEPLRPRGRPYRPGESGNPLGKPRGLRNRATLLLDKMAEADAADVLRAVLDRARAGDMAAAGMVLARLWPPRKGRPVSFDLPVISSSSDVTAALGTLIAAVGRGELTPDEAAAVGTLVETQRKAIELAELEARIAKLEVASAGY